MDVRELILSVVKEMLKHAQRDDCYSCKQILRGLDLDPSKSFDELRNKGRLRGF